ncbi:hypothetical protein Tco_1241373 [Tanacetum coccineum]
MICSSNEAKTSHDVAANLSELELKKIFIDKMENNKSIDRSILSHLKDIEMMRMKTKNPLLDQTGGPREEESAQAEEPIHADEDLEEPAHQEFKTGFTKDQPVDETSPHPVQPWISSLARNEDPRESFNELMDTPLDFSAFVLNRLKVDTLTPELLVGPTFKLMKVSLSGGVSSRTYATSVTKTKAADYGHIKSIEDLVPNTMRINREFAHDVYSRHRILAITKLKIVEWHNYKHLEWITVRRNDDKLYTFNEGDYNRLRLQDIEDMLLLLVQGKLTNLNVEERLALGVSLRMFTRSVVHRRCMEDLQLGNKDKKNRLMRIDELHKFSDDTLNDVRLSELYCDITRAANLGIESFPQHNVWRNIDRERAGAIYPWLYRSTTSLEQCTVIIMKPSINSLARDCISG